MANKNHDDSLTNKLIIKSTIKENDFLFILLKTNNQAHCR